MFEAQASAFVVVLGAQAGREVGEEEGDVGSGGSGGEGCGHGHLALKGRVVGDEADGFTDFVWGVEREEANVDHVFLSGGLSVGVRLVGLGGVEEGDAVASADAGVEGVEFAGHISWRQPGEELVGVEERVVDFFGIGSNGS